MGGGGAGLGFCPEVPCHRQWPGLGGLPKLPESLALMALGMGSFLSPQGPRSLGPIRRPGSCPAGRHHPVPAGWAQADPADPLGPVADRTAQRVAGTSDGGPGD